MPRSLSSRSLAATSLPTALALLATLAATSGSATGPSLGAAPAAATPAALHSLEWLGMAELPAGTTFEGEPVGGLSGLAWDAADGTFWAISDDPGERAPVRIYQLRVDLGDGRLQPGDVAVAGRTTLRRADGSLFPAGGLDPEGLALAGQTLYLSSEGVTTRGIAPFVAVADRQGRILHELELPASYRPATEPATEPLAGVRQNLGFESLTLTPDRRTLVAATENALAQDGPAADVEVGSRARILLWDLAAPGAAPRELVYPVEPVRPGQPPAPEAFRLNGLVDLLALSADSLLAMERQFVAGEGHQIRIFRVQLGGAARSGKELAAAQPGVALPGVAQPGEATEVTGSAALPAAAVPVHKELVLDLASLPLPAGTALGNVEGMSFGPTLPDGRRSLLLVSDDNFDPAAPTQLLAFAVGERALSVAELQGAGHVSPYADHTVLDLAGVVTASLATRRSTGFWIESPTPDDDPATAEGLWVEWTPPAGSALPATGATVRLHGRLRDRAADPRQLPLATLLATHVAPQVETTGAGAALPAPVALVTGRPIPTRHVDDDALASFDPSEDALDFWESLEGMRVVLPGGVVVGPTTGYDELMLLADGLAEDAGQPLRRTASGALRVGAAGAPPVAIPLSGRLDRLPQLDVGARLEGPVEGIVHYDFSRYKVVLTRPLVASRAETASCLGGAPRLTATPGTVTVASFNVENLSAAGPPERFAQLGAAIAGRLGSPAIVGLQEIQDDSGPTDDETVTSRRTLGLLVDGVVAHGGPRYQAVWIDPERNREGGQPGGNIRVALLFDPARLELVERGEGAPGPLTAATATTIGGRAALTASPGRVAPTSDAFTLRGGEGVRRSLAVELRVDGKPLFVAVNHWSSKWDDDRTWGARQPPVRPTGAKREAQAAVLRAWAEELLALDPAARVVVLGDLNEGDVAPAVARLGAPPLVNLVATLPDADRYSFNFEGGAEAIDHLVVSPALAAGAEIEIPHLVSDCAEERRISDHDPVLARLPLE
jgi:predicted extracellular nuclease